MFCKPDHTVSIFSQEYFQLPLHQKRKVSVRLCPLFNKVGKRFLLTPWISACDPTLAKSGNYTRNSRLFPLTSPDCCMRMMLESSSGAEIPRCNVAGPQATLTSLGHLGRGGAESACIGIHITQSLWLMGEARFWV